MLGKQGSPGHDISSLQFRPEDLDVALTALSKTASSPRTKSNHNSRAKNSKNDLESASKTPKESPRDGQKSPSDMRRDTRSKSPRASKSSTSDAKNGSRDRSKSPRERSKSPHHSPRSRPRAAQTEPTPTSPRERTRASGSRSSTVDTGEPSPPSPIKVSKPREPRSLERKVSSADKSPDPPKEHKSTKEARALHRKESKLANANSPDSKESNSKPPKSPKSHHDSTKPKELKGSSPASTPSSEPTSPRATRAKLSREKTQRDKNSKPSSNGDGGSSCDVEIEKPKRTKLSAESRPKLTRGKTDLDLKALKTGDSPKPLSARETREKKLERAASLCERGTHGRRAIKTVNYDKSDLHSDMAVHNDNDVPRRITKKSSSSNSRGSAGLPGEVRNKIDEYEKKMAETESPKRSPRDLSPNERRRHAELKKTFEDISEKLEKDAERTKKKPSSGSNSRPQSLEAPLPGGPMAKRGSSDRINYHPSSKEGSPKADRESFRKKISSPRATIIKKPSKLQVIELAPADEPHAMLIIDLTQPKPLHHYEPEALAAVALDVSPRIDEPIPEVEDPSSSAFETDAGSSSVKDPPSPRLQVPGEPSSPGDSPVKDPPSPRHDGASSHRRPKRTLTKPKGLASTDTTNDHTKPSPGDSILSSEDSHKLSNHKKKPSKEITKTSPPEKTDSAKLTSKTSKDYIRESSKDTLQPTTPKRRESASRGELPSRERRPSREKDTTKRENSQGEKEPNKRDSNPLNLTKSEPPVGALTASRRTLKRGRSLDNDQKRPDALSDLLADTPPKRQGSATARDLSHRRTSPRETVSLGGSGNKIRRDSNTPQRKPSRHALEDIPDHLSTVAASRRPSRETQDLPTVSLVVERKKPRSMSSGQALAKGVELVRMDLDSCTSHLSESWRESPTSSSRSPKSTEQRLTECEAKIARLEKLVLELTDALNYERSLRDKTLPPIGQREPTPRDSISKASQATSMPSMSTAPPTSLRHRSTSTNDLESKLRAATRSSGLDKIEETTNSAPSTPDPLRASRPDAKRSNLPELNISRIESNSDQGIKKSYSMFTSRSFSSKLQAVTSSNVFTPTKPYKTREVEFTCWLLPTEKKQKVISNFDVASMVAYLQANRLQYLAELWTKSNETSTSATKMWELRPGNEIGLVGVPLKSLLEWLTTCPPAPLQALWRGHTLFPSCFFQVYQLFFKPLELFNFLANGPSSDGTVTPQLLFLWIHITQAMEFRRNTELMSAFESYISSNPSPSSTNLRDYMERVTAQPLKPPPLLSNPKILKTKPLDILSFDPEEFARQMCLLEQQFLFSCEFHEFLNSGWMKPNLSKNIQEYIAMSNKFIYCCTTAILTQGTAEEAANIISYLVGVCQFLYKMKNFNSLLSTLSCLFSTPIQKLAPAWELVSKSNKEKYTELTNELNSSGNFKKYHETIDNIDHSKEPVIPIFSQALKNLFLLDEVVSNELPEQPGWINWEKMQKVARYIRGLKCWEVRYPFKEHSEIQEFFVNSVSWMNEDSNYAIATLRKETFLNPSIRLGSQYPIEYSTEYSAPSKLFPPPSLSDRELEILTAGAQKVLYEPNSGIVSKGDPHSFLGYLIAGRISIESFNTKKKARECAGIIKPGSFFNLAGLLGKPDYVSQNWLVTCVEDDTTIFKIDIPTALQLCETEAALSSKLHQMLAFEVALEFQNQSIVKLTKQSLVASKGIAGAPKPQQRVRAPSASLTESSQRNLKLNETFKLSGEIILKEFQCKLQQAKHSKNKDGILFISQNYVCFRTATGGFGKKKESFQLQFIRKASANGKTLSIFYSEKHASEEKADEYIFTFEEDTAATFLLNFWERKSSGTAIKEEHIHFAFEPADRNLTVDDWEVLEKGSDVQTFTPKSTLYSEKSCERVLWRIVSGNAILNYSSVYKTLKTNTANPGELFGSCSFILSSPNFCGLSAGEEKLEAKPISGYYLDILFSLNRALASRFWYHTAKIITEELLSNLPPPDATAPPSPTSGSIPTTTPRVGTK